MVKAGQLSPLTLKVQGNLAYLLSQQQHFAEAIPLARDAVERTRAAYGDGHLLVQERGYALAEVLWEADQGAEAAAILEDVRRRLLTMSGTETELSARAANQLGAAYGAGRAGARPACVQTRRMGHRAFRVPPG
jgi:hypothetical protein